MDYGEPGAELVRDEREESGLAREGEEAEALPVHQRGREGSAAVGRDGEGVGSVQHRREDVAAREPPRLQD